MKSKNGKSGNSFEYRRYQNADSKTQVLDLIQDMVYAGGNEGSP